MTTETTERPQGAEGEPGAEPEQVTPAAVPAEPTAPAPAPEPEPDWKAELERERTARKAAEELATLRDREKRGIDRRLGKVLEADRSGDAARLAQAALDEAALARAEAKDFRENKEPGATDSATAQAQAKISDRQAKEREASAKTDWEATVTRAQAEAKRALEERGYKESDPEVAAAISTWQGGDMEGAIDLLWALPKKENNVPSTAKPGNVAKTFTEAEFKAATEKAAKEAREQAKRELLTASGEAQVSSAGGASGGSRLQQLLERGAAKLSQEEIDEAARLLREG